MKTHLLRSRALALALLAAIGAAALLGTLLPQRSLTPPAEYELWRQEQALLAPLAEALGLTTVYSAWWFLALLGLLFLSLLACTISRAYDLWRAAGRGPTLPNADTRTPWGAPCSRRLQPAPAWGSVVLHLGLLVILAGGVYSGATKAAGYFELVEGQTFSETHGGYAQLSEGPFFGERHQGFRLRLAQLQTEFWPDGELRDIRSEVEVFDGQAGPRATTIKVNGALVYRGVTIYQSRQHGFAAILALADRAGRRLGEGAVNFPTPSDGSQPAFHTFRLPATGWQVLADLHPAWGERARPEHWRLPQPPRPALYLTVRDGDLTLFGGPLPLGERVAIGDYELAFLEVRRWAGFPVLHDNGVGLVFAGFALCIIGAALTLLRAPRRVAPAPAVDGAAWSALWVAENTSREPRSALRGPSK